MRDPAETQPGLERGNRIRAVSPCIVAAVMDAKLPRGVAMRDLASLPPSWAEQHRALGL